MFENEVAAAFEAARVENVSFALCAVRDNDMANCYYLITEDGVFYGHPLQGDYKPIGKFPEEPVEVILTRLTFDRSHRKC
jgi:hypothetical protein